jgi:hypothetical protein
MYQISKFNRYIVKVTGKLTGFIDQILDFVDLIEYFVDQIDRSQPGFRNRCGALQAYNSLFIAW